MERVGIIFRENNRIIVEYYINSDNALRAQFEFRKFLELNSIPYREIPDRKEAVLEIRRRAEHLKSLADKLESN